MPLAQLIMDETDRVRRLVDRMEAFSDDAPPERAPVNIHQVLDRVRALAANGVAEGLALKRELRPLAAAGLGRGGSADPDLPQPGEERRRGRSQPRGDGRGEVLITTAYRHGVRVRAGDGKAAQGAPLEVRVQDNGPGVPPHLRDHLFEPFVSSKANGVGLGLALVAKLVAAHGGLIDFESEPGRTTFRVLLPVGPRAERHSGKSMSAQSQKILIADDDSSIRLVLSQAFSRLGYQVRATGNATTLLKWVTDGRGRPGRSPTS